MERQINYATIVSDGAIPDVEIHCVAFEDPDGTGCSISTSFKGGQRTMAHMVAEIVEKFIVTLKNEQGIEAAAAMVNVLGSAFSEAGGEEVMKEAIAQRARAAASGLKGILRAMEHAGIDLDDLDLDDFEEEFE